MEPITNIVPSDDGRALIISSCKSDIVYLVSQDPKQDFEIWGYLKAPGYVLDATYTMNNNELCGLLLLSNNLAMSFYVPLDFKGNRLEPIPNELLRMGIRKLDQGSDIIFSTIWYKQYLIAGEDLVLK